MIAIVIISMLIGGKIGGKIPRLGQLVDCHMAATVRSVAIQRDVVEQLAPVRLLQLDKNLSVQVGH